MGKPITISLCMIVKDEEAVIKRNIESIREVIDEINIIDTGSSDRTKEIAKSLGCQVYDYVWDEDFGAARNFAFSKATKEFVMWLDADDIVKPSELEKLKVLKQDVSENIVSINMHYVLTEGMNGETLFSLRRNRIVRRNQNFQWIGFIHEYLHVVGETLYVDISIHHKKEKTYTDRNLRIYEKKLEKGYVLSVRDQFYYANELYDHGRDRDAINAYQLFINTKQGWVEDVKSACLKMSVCYERLGNSEKQIQVLLKALEYDVPRSDICCYIGFYFYNHQQYQQAIFWFELAIQCKPENNIAAIDHSTYTWLPNLQLAVCYAHIGDYEKANDSNEKAGNYIPDDPKIIHNRGYFKTKLKEVNEG